MRAPCSSVPAADLVVVVGGVGFEVVEVVGAGVDDDRECRVPLPEGIEEREARNMIFLNYRCALYR